MKYSDYAEGLGFIKNISIYVMEYEGFQIYLNRWQYMVSSIPSFFIPLDHPLDKA
jgi:hypothetical protein